MHLSPKSTFCAMLASVLMFAGIAIPASATAATNVAARDLDAEVTSNALVTGITPEAGSKIDNIYVSWESEGTEPIESSEEGVDPITVAYYAVTIGGGGYAQCDSSQTTIGTHELAIDETVDATCRIRGLKLDQPVEITVTPFIAAQFEGELDAMGTSFTTYFTPAIAPSAPTVTATVSSAKQLVTVRWSAGENSDSIIGWRVDAAGLTVDGEGTCTVWDEIFDEEMQETIWTDSGQLLDSSTDSCTIPTDNYDATSAFPVVVLPVYGDSAFIGPFGAAFVGAKAAADPGFITNFDIVATGLKTAKVSWKLLGMTGAPAITKQTVSAFDPQDTRDEPVALDKCSSLSVTSRTCTLTKLVPGKSYQIVVSVENINAPVDSSSYPWSFYTQPAPPTPRDLNGEVTNTALVTGITAEAGSAIDNIYVSWESEGTEPIESTEEDGEPTTVAYYAVTVDGGGFAQCDSTEENVGSHEILFDETSDVTCRVGGLELDRTVSITVTPFIAALSYGETETMGTSLTTEFTPTKAPSAPTVTATVSSARQLVTINWSAGANSDSLVGWRVDAGDLTVDGGGTCTIWDETFDEDLQETVYGDSGELLDPSATSCTIPSDNYDASSAFPLLVYPVYGESVLDGPFGAAFIGAKAAASPGFITNFEIATSGAKAAKVTWKILGMTGAPAITSQTVSAFDPLDTRDEPVALDKCALLSLTDRTCTLTKLVAGKKYLISVSVENVNGIADSSAFPWAFYTQPVPPSSPTDFTATDDGSQLIFDWTPAWNGGSKLTKYTLTEVGSNTPICGTVVGSAISCVFTGTSLTKPKYIFELIASNGASFSEPVTTEFFPIFPDAVSDVAVSITGRTTANVMWDSALDADQYEVTVNGKVVVCPEPQDSNSNNQGQEIDPDVDPIDDSTSDQNVCEISELSSNKTYKIGVKSIRWNASSAVTTNTYVHPSGPTIGARLYEIGANGRSAIIEAYLINSANDLTTSYSISTTDLANNEVVDTRDCEDVLCVVEGLSPSRRYNFTVIGSTIAGPSTPQSVIATMPSPPTFPRNVAVKATAPSNALVTWKAVEKTDYYTVTVTQNGNTETYDTAENSVSIQVESANSYEITVVATNVVGQGLDSATVRYVHPLAPVAPTAIRAFSDSLTTALVTWTPSDLTNGGPVDTYSVGAYLNDELISSCQPTPATTCLLSGLSNETYDIRVTAQNVIGTSQNASMSYLVPSAPGAPKVLAEALTNAQWKSVKVSWRVTDTGGLPINSVVISVTENQQNVIVSGTCAKLGSTTSDCLLTGLTAGKTYEVSVSIANSAGNISSSTSVKIPDVPKPVTNILSSQTGEETATLVWTKSENADSYSVTVLDSNSKAVTCIGGSTTYQPTCLLAGLTGGETYSVSVISNRKGIGSSQPATSSYTQPITPPKYQVSLEFLPTSTSIMTVNWVILDANVTNIPASLVTAIKTDGTTMIAVCENTNDLVQTCEFDSSILAGYIVQGSYRFQLNGLGIQSNIRKIRSLTTPPDEEAGSFNIVIPVPPTEVTNLDVNALTSTSALATWDSIDDSSVSYDVRVNGELVCDGVEVPLCEIANELGAQSVIISVTAKNLIGESPAVTFDYAAPALPEAPTDIVSQVSSSGSSLTSWSIGTNASDTTYSVYLEGELISNCTDLVNPVCLVTDLIPGSEYQITIAAKNVVGSAETSLTLSQPVPATAPIVQAQVSEDGTSINFSWELPEIGGAAPTGIEIRLNPSQGTSGCTEIDLSANSCVLEGLTAGVKYTFAVRLITTAGAGSFGFASAINAELLETPSNVAISRISDTEASITWDALENADSYQVYINGTLNDICSTAGVGCTIEIDTTEPITVMVSGINNFSTSGFAKSAMAGRTIAGPKRVVAVSSVDGRSINLSWKVDSTTTSQEITYTSTTGVTGCDDLSVSATSCTVTGLTPGTANTFVLRSYDEGSAVTESEVIGNTLSLPTPKAASGLTVALVKKVATLTWISSVSQITNRTALPTYSVTLNGKLVKCTVDAASPSCALGSLASTGNYSVKVTATLGSKSVSSKEFKFTAKSVATVGFLTSKFTATGATLTWQDLPKLKASGITVAVSPKATGCKNLKANAKNCTLTALVPGTSYTATVTIRHKKGAATKIVRNFVAPPALSAPADLDVQLTGDRQARVWITPGFDSVGNSYVCSSTNKTLVITFDSATTSCLITNVTSASATTVSVYAKKGTSKSGASLVTWTAPTAPRAVSDLDASIKSGFVTVSWLPNTSGNQNITGYRISSPKSTSIVVDATTFSTKVAVTGVNPGSDVNFTVVALSQVGDGTSATVVVTALDLPSVVHSGSISGNWTSASTAAISWHGVEGNADYRVSISSLDNSATEVCQGHATVCLLDGLSKDGDYAITITAFNAAGESTADAVIWHHGTSDDNSEMINP